MGQEHLDIAEFHWILEMLQSVDVGLVVVDREFNVHIWNGFMENHSSMLPTEVRGENLFALFSDLDEDWFRRKSEPVFMMKAKAFTIFEQRPYLFHFKNYRPITGNSPFMYQNVTLFPLANTRGDVTHMCIMIYDMTEIAEYKLEVQQANQLLEKLSQEDSLTQLYNRGFWEQQLVREFKRGHRTSQNTSLVIFDIDHFKKLNDGYGHAAGDECIRSVSQLLQMNLRETDIAGRYGGEEFAVILIDTDENQALVFAQRFRKAVEMNVVEYHQQNLKFTVSVGIAQFSRDFSSHEQWIEAADEALYKVKNSGRNNVAVYEQK